MDITRVLKALDELKELIEGEIFTDYTMRLLYATDASAYREIPMAVCRPKHKLDIIRLMELANRYKVPLIPRAAGTSLAGQVVGNGIIIDVSKYMNNIIEINEKQHWVRVESGVVLDELNKILAEKGLFFGPETSTSNRCMMGGMVGNNSCGAHSLVYGSTRDHIISMRVILSDSSEVEFAPLTNAEFEAKLKGDLLENKLYRQINEVLSNKDNQAEILAQYPDKSLERRNTGYAIDLLMDMLPFTANGAPFNFSTLLAGSEGTLAFTTEIKLNLVPLPPKYSALVCIHCHSLDDALKGNIIALKHKPVAIELMDDIIMNCTKDNIEQRKNRFFIEGDPKAMLIVEFAMDNEADILDAANKLEEEMKNLGYGYHFPVILGEDIKKVWNLRKAGLGVLSNIPGDAKPVPVIEDTAVNPAVLPEYINEFRAVLDKYKLSCVYYAHIATGELHLRPVLNLKDPADVELFHTIALETAKLVKKYKGSLSGEHGDGRLRGEFIPLMIGEKNYEILKQIKQCWDPDHIFNPGKIVDTPSMNSFLRYEATKKVKNIKTIFDFSKEDGILRAAEKCNGSGDCRKSEIIGGTMCPSFMATKDESASTRGRANILREFLTNSPKKNPFNHYEIYKVFDLCLSCKACKSECPSSVDVAKLKAEFLQHYYDANGIPLRTRAIAYISRINAFGSLFTSITNFFLNNKTTSNLLKKILGFAKKRSIPLLSNITLKKWASKNISNQNFPNGKVYLFADEFTNYNESHIGIKAIQLLNKLGYEVVIPRHKDSGRTFLSKGLLRTAKKIAVNNTLLLKDIITAETPLIGLEPSAILSFRDEYPELVGKELQESAIKLAASAFMFDEFFMKEVEKGKIKKESFTISLQHIKLHGHCQQKSIASTLPTKKMLAFPENFSVEEIPSGCCGMAGSFGYEKEHYYISMKVGEMVLFPAIRNSSEETIIAALGTSCRCQIKDGTKREALHPVEIMYNALKD
ncbi:MAG: FAD-binding protein [Bacteroidetes bacterium]|nr:FAD-binding protein [Bacteroidota bacterium]